EAACRADDVPIARRSSGGGTVLLGPGCLCFSLILRFDRDPALADLHASYRYILGRIAARLAEQVAHVGMNGSSDLTLGERKFSGNEQPRKRTHPLHHGTLLHAFDFELMARYLKSPPRQPEYRRQRSHADFLTNLPIAGEMLGELMREIWDAREALPRWPEAMVSKLVAEKYATDEWTRRR